MRVDLERERFFTQRMRTLLLVCGLISLAAPGCFRQKTDSEALYSPAPFIGATETNAVAAAPSTNMVAVTVPAAGNPALSQPSPSPEPISTPKTAPIVTPAEGLAGKVASFNATGRFVVISFPIGQMPAFDRRMSIYRRGLKVGEIKITGPKLDENIVADLLEGAAEAGDDVRD